MDSYLPLVGFLVIALLWALLLFGSLRFGFKIKKKSLIAIIFIFIGLGILIIVMGAVVEWMDSPEFCGTMCHPRAGIIVDDEPMKPYYESYEDPENNQIMSTHVENDVTCANCHDSPSLTGKITAYVRAIPEMFNYVTGNYDKDHLEGHVADENCLKCHDGDVASKPGELEITFYNTTPFSTNPHDDDKDCVDCHNPHEEGIGLTEEACSSCHGTTPEVFTKELEEHGETAGTDCWTCHDRKHPGDAKIPFSDSTVTDLINNEFCSDCHQDANNAVSAWSDTEKSLFSGSENGTCTKSCHTEHKEKDVAHITHATTATYTDYCNTCHVEGVASHDLLNINFTEFPSTIGLENEFCSDCHEDEFKAVSTWTVGEKLMFGNCSTACHTEHKEYDVSHITHTTNSLYKDDCDSCHPDELTSHNLVNVGYSNFEPELENDFCKSCHQDEFETLDKTIHSVRDCMDCHSEHKQTQILNFDRCGSCHYDGNILNDKELNDIPPELHENQIGCAEASCHKHKIEVISDVIHSTKQSSG